MVSQEQKEPSSEFSGAEPLSEELRARDGPQNNTLLSAAAASCVRAPTTLDLVGYWLSGGRGPVRQRAGEV